jgi:PAS domain S-box-containing protein
MQPLRDEALIGRQRSDEALRISEERFRILVESIPHHVWSVRRDGSLGYWNQQMADYTGLTAEQLRRGGWEAVHPDDVERVRAAWQKTREEGTSYEMEQRLRGRDGHYRRFVCHAAALKDEHGQPVEWFGTNTDVEERHRAENALLMLQTELAHVSRTTTLGELAASIAHEVNQPLTAVITNGHACMRWLAQKTPDLREATEAAERIVRDAKRASEVITRIRAFLKRGTREVVPTNLNEAISEVIAMVQAQVRNQGVSLRIAPAEHLPPVAADRIQLQQVILNLVMNALDAMSATRDRARILQIEVHHHDADALRVAVCDSGAGLVPGQRDRVFDAFHTTKPHGMGMGLAISRSIVESHGGSLWATPNQDHGETFHFTLPIAAP